METSWNIHLCIPGVAAVVAIFIPRQTCQGSEKISPAFTCGDDCIHGYLFLLGSIVMEVPKKIGATHILGNGDTLKWMVFSGKS